MTINTIRNFEIWVETKKNSSRHEKRNASLVRETADQLSCQSMFQRRASIQNGVWLASEYRIFFFFFG